MRAARAAGYQLRAQEFKAGGGKMIAARSTPDPKATPIARGWLKRTGEVVRNAWEHGTIEFWDEDVADARVRTEERLVAVFKADRGWFGWGRAQATKVSLALDATDYGREDWVIRRAGQPADRTERMYRAIGDCLGVVAPAVEIVSPTRSTEPGVPSGSGEGVPGARTREGPEAAAAQPAEQAPPDQSEAVARGRKAYESGDFAGAVAALQPVVAADPQHAEALGYLGASCYQLKRRDEAIAAYERYVALVPSDLRTKEFLEELKKTAP